MRLVRLLLVLATAALAGCGGGDDCAAFGQQYCLPANGARCYNGTCQCCWSIQSGGTYACYGCVAACTSRGYACAADGTCVFPPPPAGPACSGAAAPSGCPTPPNCGKGTHQQNCQCVPN